MIRKLLAGKEREIAEVDGLLLQERNGSGDYDYDHRSHRPRKLEEGRGRDGDMDTGLRRGSDGSMNAGGGDVGGGES